MDGGSGGSIGGGSGAGGDGIGVGGRKDKGKKIDEGGGSAEPTEEFPIPEDFGDGSTILFNWAQTHKHLLQVIFEQKEDDCWARALVRILEFFYNKDITEVAQQKTLSIKSLVKHVILGRLDVDKNKKLDGRSLAVSSLKRAIAYILNTGIERDYGTQKFKIKASFLTKPNATPEEIRSLLHTQGPIGISIDLDEEVTRFHTSKTIHNIREPQAGKKRHALIIVGYGVTKENKLFFIVQNSWGVDWGFNGYGRIFIETTCPIFYVAGLVN